MSTTQHINDSDFDSKPSASPEVGQTRLSRLASIAMALEILSIALWLGGLVTIGAIVAPVAFHEVRDVIVSDVAAKALAGAIIGSSLRIFNFVSAGCAVILTIGMLSRDPRLRRFAAYKIAAVALFLLCCSVAILAGVLFPAMDLARATGSMTRFDSLHKTYEQLSQAQMLLLIIFTGCYASIKTFRIFDE